MGATTIGQRLKDYITFHGSDCGAGVSEERVSAFEHRNRILVPPDLRTYFITMNGTAGDYAYGIIRFWSLDELQSISQEISAKRTHKALIQSRYREPIEEGDTFFVFADCLHEAQLFAIYLSPQVKANPVIILDGDQPRKVADSFSHFVELYLASPERLQLIVD
jgi:hypothetical protein